METNNPYEPPHSNIDMRRRFRVSLSSTEIFTIGAVLAVLVTMFAPAQPHPKEYTVIEKILIALTSNWLTIMGTVLGFAAFLTVTCYAVGRIWYRFDQLGGPSHQIKYP